MRALQRHRRRGSVAEGLVARAARRGQPVRARARRMAAYRGPQQGPSAAVPGAAKPPCRPRTLKDSSRPRGAGAQRRRSDRAAGGPMTAFLRPEQGGIDLAVIPTQQREENAVIGPAPARCHIACISHQLAAAAGVAPHPAVLSPLGVLDVLSSTTPRPSEPHWVRHLAALATKAGEKCRIGRGCGATRRQPAGAPKARSGRGRCDRRELALGGRNGRGRVAAVADRGRRADFSTAGTWRSERGPRLSRPPSRRRTRPSWPRPPCPRRP